MKKILIILTSISLIFSACQKETNNKQTTNKIRVAVFKGNGASPTCVIETFEALKIDTGISPEKITAIDIMNGKLNNFDAIIFPGGSGSKELNNIGDMGASKIKEFVNAGKGVVGICAGGYLFSTTKGYPSLRLTSATEWDRAHYNKGRALVEFKPTNEGLKIFPELKNKKTFLQYYDGPVLMASDSGKSGNQLYTELAKYVSDIKIHPNYPGGITPNKTFMLDEKVGDGRAIVVAGHPEATPGMRWMIPRMARWAANKELIKYNTKWIRPQLNDSAIFFTDSLVKIEKNYFWKLFSNNTEEKLNAMQNLYELRSRPAVRWNMGLLRDNNPLVRTKAATLLQQAEYTAALPDLETAFKIEKDNSTKIKINEAIKFLSKY